MIMSKVQYQNVPGVFIIPNGLYDAVIYAPPEIYVSPATH